MKLWSASISVSVLKDSVLTTLSRPATAWAGNIDEARGLVLGEALRLYPRTEGWYDHQAAVIEIPDDLIEKVRSVS